MPARLAIAAILVAQAGQFVPPDSGYPTGLFENSPVVRAAPARQRHRDGHRRPKSPEGCHHYRDWSYPYPQPC